MYDCMRFWLIFWGKFSMILADFLLPGSVSISMHFWLAEMIRIQTDPDPKHRLI